MKQRWYDGILHVLAQILIRASDDRNKQVDDSLIESLEASKF